MIVVRMVLAGSLLSGLKGASGMYTFIGSLVRWITMYPRGVGPIVHLDYGSSVKLARHLKRKHSDLMRYRKRTRLRSRERQT